MKRNGHRRRFFLPYLLPGSWFQLANLSLNFVQGRDVVQRFFGDLALVGRVQVEELSAGMGHAADLGCGFAPASGMGSGINAGCSAVLFCVCKRIHLWTRFAFRLWLRAMLAAEAPGWTVS